MLEDSTKIIGIRIVADVRAPFKVMAGISPALYTSRPLRRDTHDLLTTSASHCRRPLRSRGQAALASTVDEVQTPTEIRSFVISAEISLERKLAGLARI